MANVTDKSILTAAGKALLAQLNAEEKALVIDKMIFANVPNRPEYPQPDDVVPSNNVVHEAAVEQRGRLSVDSVIYSTTLTSQEGPFEFNWTGAYCSEYGVLVTIDHHALTPKTADEPGVSGNTLVRSVVLEYKDIAEITNITVDASTWQYNATPRMKKMDNDVAQANIDQNGKDWFIEDGFLVTPQASAFNIKAGAGYVSGNRVTLEFDRNVQVPNKPSFIYVDAHREGTPTGEQVTLFDFVVTAEEKDDYTDANGVKHFVCKIAQVLVDGSVSDLRPEGESATKNWVSKNEKKQTGMLTRSNSFLVGTEGTLVGSVVTIETAVQIEDYPSKGMSMFMEITPIKQGVISQLDLAKKLIYFENEAEPSNLKIVTSVKADEEGEIEAPGYKSIDIRVSGQQRPLAYFGKLTDSNHSDVLAKAISAACEEGFKLYIPKSRKLELSSWNTLELDKSVQIEFQDYSEINTDKKVDFIRTKASVLHDGIVTLDGFLTGFKFINIHEGIEIYSRGFRCQNMESVFDMRYAENMNGSLIRAIINDAQGHNLDSWGIDISPAMFGDIFINWPKFTNCKTRFIGIGNNNSGETFSNNQRVEINSFYGKGLREKEGIDELQGIYLTGCENVHLGNQTTIEDLVHTSSSVHAEGLYIKAADTYVENAILKNAGGNQGMIVIKGANSDSSPKTKCTVNAKLTSTYESNIPTCPAYVQADDVTLNLELNGTFTRGVNTVQGAKVNSLDVTIKSTDCTADTLVEITPNCESITVRAPVVKGLKALHENKKPSVVRVGGSSSNPGGIMKILKVTDINAREFSTTDGAKFGSLVEVDLGSDVSAVIGKVSVMNNDAGDLTSCVTMKSGHIQQLAISNNDCMGGATPIDKRGGTVDNEYVQNNPGAPV
ncbi:phage tail protein [Vibrio splendidus]|uniref:phage tail protein n=1 Tax=Vibrio splendidus TaxID=29497 RepID=UPI002158F6D0|nr:phage tail protein [Vibrio splendidus]